jgi:hypothetical protein
VTILDADAQPPAGGDGSTAETKTYPGPEPGKARTYDLPRPVGPVNILDGILGFVDADGKPAAGPFDAAFEARAQGAGELCWIMLLRDPDESVDNYPGPGERFGTCLAAVLKVLIRYDQLHHHARRDAHAAAAKRCSVFGNPAARRLLRFTCTATATGAHVAVKPRKRGTRLSRLLRGRAPRLIVRRSAHDKSGKAFTKVRWR